MACKFESLITIPTGDYDATLTETGGGGASGTVTLTAAKTYYHSSDGNDTATLQEKLKTLMDAIGNATYTVTMADTGKYTISCTGGGVTSFAITWTDTALRDLLGWTGDISGSTSYTSPEAAEGFWAPDVMPMMLANVDATWAGWDETDLHQLESPAGHVYSVAGERKVVNNMRFYGCAPAKTWIAKESTVNESFQKFYRDCVYGSAGWGTPGGPVRYHNDITDDAVYHTYYVVGPKDFRPEYVREQFVGMYDFSLPRLVQDPSET